MKELERLLACVDLFFFQLINCLLTGFVSRNLLIAITQEMFAVNVFQAVDC